mgnify:CR=1 FL=1
MIFRIKLLVIFILLSSTTFYVKNIYGQSLEESLVAAYKNNPLLKSQRASLRATDEQIPQALSGFRPSLTLSTSASVNHVQGKSTGSTDTKPRSLSLSLSQPLYRGGRTTNTIKQAEANIIAARARINQSEQSILQSVIRIYMDVLRDTAVVELNLSNEERLKKQAQATRDRFDVGEVTRTDVAQAEARLSRVISERVAAEGSLGVSKATFIRITGIEAKSLTRVPPISFIPSSVDEAISLALEKNPALIQALSVQRAAIASIEIAKSSMRPTVTINGSLTTAYDSSSFNYITETAQVSTSLSVPIFQGGTLSSQVRQAKQLASQRKLELEQQRQTIIEGVTSAWTALQSASDRIRSNIVQVEAAEIALDGVIQEAEVGARTTLDVLDAEQELLDAQVALVRAERDEFVAAFDLRLAIGTLSAEELGLPTTLYDPNKNYNLVKNKLFGVEIIE